ASPVPPDPPHGISDGTPNHSSMRGQRLAQRVTISSPQTTGRTRSHSLNRCFTSASCALCTFRNLLLGRPVSLLAFPVTLRRKETRMNEADLNGRRRRVVRVAAPFVAGAALGAALLAGLGGVSTPAAATVPTKA